MRFLFILLIFLCGCLFASDWQDPSVLGGVHCINLVERLDRDTLLWDAYHDPKPEQALSAAKGVIYQLAPEGKTKLLEHFTEHENPQFRKLASFLATDLRGPEREKYLARLVNDPNPTVAEQSYDFLYGSSRKTVRINTDDGPVYRLEPFDEPAVRKLFHSAPIELQAHILRSISNKFGDCAFHLTSGEIPILKSLFQNVSLNPTIRAHALEGLIELGAVPNKQVLLELLDSQDLARMFQGEWLLQATSVALQKSGAFSNRNLPDLIAHANKATRIDSSVLELAQRDSPEAIACLKRLANSSENSPLTDFAREALLYQHGRAEFHPLYKSQKDNAPFFDDKSSVKALPFEKTGSETFLLSGPLAGKVIARSILPEHLTEWRRALSAGPEWKAAGFDYVPIEPIIEKTDLLQKHHLDSSSQKALSDLESAARKKGEVIVYTSVLMGPSVEFTDNWHSNTGLYPPSWILQAKGDSIRKVVGKIGINHGHPHFGNFVIQKDMSGKSRIYMIDFDQASKSDSDD